MISTVTYNGDGVTRIFPVAFEIKGEEYTVVYVGGVAIADRSLYDIINNSIVFNTAPITGTNNVEIVVASTTTEIADLNAPPSTIQTVLDNIGDINAIVASVIPNLPEILLADDNATIATTKAGEASTSASEALASKNSALTSAGNALTSETNADISEANALSYKNSAEASATTATTQAGIATAKAGEASTSATQALGYKDLALGYRNDAEGFATSINPSTLVHNTGNETIAGVKTFTSSPIVPTPTSGNASANKDYVDSVTTLNINAFTDKPIPSDTDNLAIQETGGLLKKVSFENLKENINNILQVVYAENKVVGSGSLTIPDDGTIPQITEGNEILTCTITPKKANSRLLIEFTPSCQEVSDTGNIVTVACFRNGVSNALYVTATASQAAANLNENNITGRFIISTPTTSPLTFSLRAGVAAGSTRWNQIKYNATVMNTSTTMTITEIAQ